MKKSTFAMAAALEVCLRDASAENRAKLQAAARHYDKRTNVKLQPALRTLVNTMLGDELKS